MKKFLTSPATGLAALFIFLLAGAFLEMTITGDPRCLVMKCVVIKK